jgi:hypothetical protein
MITPWQPEPLVPLHSILPAMPKADTSLLVYNLAAVSTGTAGCCCRCQCLLKAIDRVHVLARRSNASNGLVFVSWTGQIPEEPTNDDDSDDESYNRDDDPANNDHNYDGTDGKFPVNTDANIAGVHDNEPDINEPDSDPNVSDKNNDDENDDGNNSIAGVDNENENKPITLDDDSEENDNNLPVTPDEHIDNDEPGHEYNTVNEDNDAMQEMETKY